MVLYIGTEFLKLLPADLDIQPTGRVMTYQAESIEEAVGHCLYTERLRNGNAYVGPTGRVVHSGGRSIVITKEKSS